MLFVGLDLALCRKLFDFAFCDYGRGVAQNSEHLEASILDHELERTREKKIANKNACRISPNEVRRALSSPQSRAVDNVVMKKRRGMNEFDRSSEFLMASAWITEQSCARERQHRTHALPAACDEMPGKFRNQRNLALHAFEDHRVDPVHVSGDECHQRVERSRPVSSQLWIVADTCSH